MRIGTRLLLPALAIAALLVAAIACDTGEGSLSASELAALGQYDQGIRVTGTGTVSVAPDLATLRLGVETTAESADEARREASTTMNAIMDVLRARGIEDSDVQTAHFSIEPEYHDWEPYHMGGEPYMGAVTEALDSIGNVGSSEGDFEDAEAFAEFMAAMMAMGMMAEGAEDMDLEDSEGFAEFMAAMMAMGMMAEGVEDMDLEDAEGFAEFMAAMMAMGMMAEGVEDMDLEDAEGFTEFMGMLLAMGMMAGEDVGGYPGDPGILADDYSVEGLAPVGYRVTNTAEVKVRDLDSVGAIIDEIVEAGGDATRVDGVWFSVEDTTEAQQQAREMAMNDAVARADELAAHAGAVRGKLLRVSEDSFGSDGFYGEIAVLEARGTPIGGGEQEVRVSVHASFAIE